MHFVLYARVVESAVLMGSLAYLLFALFRVATFYEGRLASARSRRAAEAGHDDRDFKPPPSPPITVLKPVHGADAELYQNLKSFCEQDYPVYQTVFSVASPEDTALPVVQKIIADYAQHDISLVISDRHIGLNSKISNVANAYPLAKYDLLVIADSDMRVRPDYLRCIARAFEGSEVGAVTCLYKGSPVGSMASYLGCMYINESFVPSVLVALSVEGLKYCFGATMAVRKEALSAIGGWTTLSAFLADDYMLGKLVTQHGYKVAMADCLVENVVQESSMKTLWQHELRWARTIRTVRPVGYALSILTQPVPLAALGLFLSPPNSLGFLFLTTALGLRVLLHFAARQRFQLRGRAAPWLIPIREVLNFSVWVASFFGSRVQWRGRNFLVNRNGHMVKKERIVT